MASWVDRLVEASFNKRAPEGYVFRSLSPWLLRPHYYLVNDVQKVVIGEGDCVVELGVSDQLTRSNTMYSSSNRSA